MQSVHTIWNHVLEELQREMTSLSYNSWILPIDPVCLQDTSFVLQVPGELAQKTLRNLYSSTIDKALHTVVGRPVYSQIILPADRNKYVAQPAQIKAGHALLNPRYTFDNFVIGSSNAFAHAACKAVADSPARAYNPLFIYGGVGLGKTHLMHAIGNQIREYAPECKIMYVTSETFTYELIQSIQENTNTQFRNRYRNVDVLMVDDIQFISGKVSTQEEFFNTFNALQTSGKQIVLSSDKPPMEMTTLEERLRSRFEGGLITDIQQPDIETRIAILKMKALLENIDVEEDILSFIAEKVNSNIRQLEGSLTRVIAYSKLTGKPITTTLADTALKDIIPGYENRKVTVELIQQIVADYYHIDLGTMLSQRRTAEITYPRQVSMYLCREMTEVSLKTIGKHFGGRDYSTVISACNKISDDIKTEPALSITLEDIKKRIKK
ncbi:MAG: chromosomal replication initiator protein DnaA [Christensenellaceae bacterium]|nr:chromosomal replication initiator protein DnaA [Christensenellaceae bacterium]